MATKKKPTTKKNNGKSAIVLVRTYSAGVHFGRLGERRGAQELDLHDARRIWYWKGANTLHEISLNGVSATGSKVSEPVSKITLLQAIEILPMTPAALAAMEKVKWG